ncbi:MAG: hypothetical protein K2K95_06550, partial [Muribaculaceae bacterium]|nr:hypothetical protein [Muribaculaceae bacterium]
TESSSSAWSDSYNIDTKIKANHKILQIGGRHLAGWITPAKILKRKRITTFVVGILVAGWVGLSVSGKGGSFLF